jgi:hypothetical protein
MAESQSFLGNRLNVEQRVAVKTALAKLSINERLTDARFWGKIFGSQNDYLIAVSIATGDAVTKSFYFSNDDGRSFAKLPAADEWARNASQGTRGTFTGNMSFVHQADAGADAGERELTELERLAAVVAQIEEDTCVVPVGALFLSPSGAIQNNDAFTGLGGAADTLASYSLLREPQHDRTLACIRKGGATNNVDFLDRIEDDQPTGTWQLQVSDGADVVRLRNLLWPGFEARGEAGSAAFARAYYGYGERNDDLMFMLSA